MSWASSGACLGHHPGHVWGIIWGMYGACLAHHLVHIVNNGQQSAVLHASVMPFFPLDHEHEDEPSELGRKQQHFAFSKLSDFQTSTHHQTFTHYGKQGDDRDEPFELGGEQQHQLPHLLLPRYQH